MSEILTAEQVSEKIDQALLAGIQAWSAKYPHITFAHPEGLDLLIQMKQRVGFEVGQHDEALRVSLAAVEQERDELRTRTVMAEHRSALERMGRSSVNEAIEDRLREQLAEVELRAEKAEARERALVEWIDSDEGLGCPCGNRDCDIAKAALRVVREMVLRRLTPEKEGK